MVEQDAVGAEQPVAFLVVVDDPEGVQLRDGIGAARMEGGFLGLQTVLMTVAEHFGGGRLVEARGGREMAHGLQQPQHTDGVHLGAQDGLAP